MVPWNRQAVCLPFLVITHIFFFYDEARLEPMSLSDPARSRIHGPRTMLQIFSIKLAKVHVDGGLVELYGYIAVRDALDPLLNYVMSFSRDDPIIVEQVHINNYLQLFQITLLVSEY